MSHTFPLSWRTALRTLPIIVALAACSGDEPTVLAPPAQDALATTSPPATATTATSTSVSAGTTAAGNAGQSIPAGTPTPGPNATGTIRGTVTTARGDTVVGATVELGRWTGAREDFAFGDSSSVSVSLTDTRMTVVERATTDAKGQFVFTNKDGMTLWVLRALPPAGSSATGAYFPSLFWLFGGPQMSLSVRLR